MKRVESGRQQRRRIGEDAERQQEMVEEALQDFSIDELREFLEADLLDVPVDPEFKERLRERLWDLVRANAPREGGEPEDGS